MKITKLILFLFAVAFNIAYSQVEEKIIIPPVIDSVKLLNTENPLMDFGNKMEQYETNLPLLNLKGMVLSQNLSSTINIKTYKHFSFEDDGFYPTADFLSPLYSQYVKQQNMKTLYYILGMAQYAAVGYLAVEHIRKYGFWDKKKK